VSGMTGISAPGSSFQIGSRGRRIDPAHRAKLSVQRNNVRALDCRYDNCMTDHVLPRHADILNYKSADFPGDNSVAIIRSQRFWKRVLTTSRTRPGDLPHRDGFFLRTAQRCPFNFLRVSNIDHRCGVCDRRFALENRSVNAIPGHRVYGRARRAWPLAMGRVVGKS
jgi:hypothetical protein